MRNESFRVHLIVPVRLASPVAELTFTPASMVIVTFVKSLNSNAPRSGCASRGTYRWSIDVKKGDRPALRAGLVYRMACVLVGPPLSASGRSCGSPIGMPTPQLQSVETFQPSNRRPDELK